jgi:hypothetical protein
VGGVSSFIQRVDTETEGSLKMESFFITLISNATESSKKYPDNTVAKFTTQLYNSIELNDNYEIALKEFICPISFFNITEKEYSVTEDLKFTAPNQLRSIEIGEYHIPAGNYTSIHRILKFLNEIPFIATKLEVIYDEISGHVALIEFDLSPKLKKIEKKKAEKRKLETQNKTEESAGSIAYSEGSAAEEIVDPGFGFDFSPKLRHLLGFKQGVPLAEGPAPFPVNLYINVPQQLLIYCDIVEPHLVGDNVSRLLRNVGIEDITKFGNLFVKTYDNPDYLPLLKYHFSTIEIDIRVSNDDPAPFQFGPSLVKVHFKKVRSTY